MIQAYEAVNMNFKLLPTEVETRWGAFDELLRMSVIYQNAVTKYINDKSKGEIIIPMTYWAFVDMIRNHLFKPLRDMTAAACSCEKRSPTLLLHRSCRTGYTPYGGISG